MDSKFFGRPNGSAPKAQQSTLAFQKPRAPSIVKGEDEEGESIREVKAEDDDGDVEMDEPVKEEESPGNADEVKLENGGSKDDISSTPESTPKPLPKRSNSEMKDDEDEEDEEPVRKRSRRGEDQRRSKQATRTKPTKSIKPILTATSIVPENKNRKPDSKQALKSAEDPLKTSHAAISSSARSSGREKGASKGSVKAAARDVAKVDGVAPDDEASEVDDEEAESEEEDKPELAAKAREKVQLTLKSSGKDPYPDWKLGEPVPYAALCTTFSLVEMTTKRLIISAHCSLFLRQVMRLTPQDLLPTVQLMINKLAADYAGIELGIGESLIMKAIGETTGRSLQVIKADQNEIGDLGLVAAKSRSNQPTMFKPKPLTVKGVLDGLMGIATVSGDGSQGRKIAGIKKLLSGADAAHAGKGSKGIDISKDKGGASEAKFIIRFLEGKLRLGLAERTVLVALAHAMVIHETEKKDNKLPTTEKLAEGEAILKTVYRLAPYSIDFGDG